MFFKIIIRNLSKNLFITISNTVSLAIGITLFLLVALYVKFETSFEDFNDRADLIYRVKLDRYKNNELIVSTAENFPGAGPALLAEIPEVERYCRLYNLGYKNNVIITNEDVQPAIKFKQKRFLYAEPNFLPMMGYRLVSGDMATALTRPNSAVITRQMAKAYFGNADPMGRMLRMRDDDNNNELVTITGVIGEVAENTHLKFDILFSYSTLFQRKGDTEDYASQRFDLGWRRKDMYTFIQIKEGADPRTIESKLPAIVDKYVPDAKEQGRREIMSLQPLTSIHLESHLSDEPEINSDGTIVKTIGIVGIFVLIVAWINYVNISTAKAMERAKEVGVRKVMGALKTNLISQFLQEALAINLIAVVVALIAVILTLPLFNSLSGLSLTVKDLGQSWFIALAALLWIAGGLLSGFYPALVLSAFKPVTVLKGKLKNNTKGILLRKSLVVFQLVASLALIAGTFIVNDQLNYMMNRNIGLRIDQVLVVERPAIAPQEREAFTRSIDVFRNELRKNPDIQSVTASSTIPGKQRQSKTMIKRFGAADEQLVTLRVNSMDYEFIDVFDVEVKAGRGFSEKFPADPETAVILTETAVRQLGYQNIANIIGQQIEIPDWEWNPTVIGVVNDYHQESLRKSLEPTIFYCTMYDGEYYSAKINKASPFGVVVDDVRKAWDKAFPGNPFEYFFLDDYFNQQYKMEMRLSKLFVIFSIIAIVLAVLGLLGLSSYTTLQRRKEIGVRKVLGASNNEILVLMLREYLILVVVASLVGIPLVYFSMSGWIQSFAYRTPISAITFAGASLALAGLCLATVAFHAYQGSRANPITAIQSE